MSTTIGSVNVHGLAEADVAAVFGFNDCTYLRLGQVVVFGSSPEIPRDDLVDRAAAFHRLASEAGKVAEELTRQVVARQVSA